MIIDGVAMREITLHDKEQPKFVVYDTSGPYTDELVKIDINKGLAKKRAEWIAARGDVENYQGREVQPEDNGFKEWQLKGTEAATGKSNIKLVAPFPLTNHKPLRAKGGKAVTQMAYARAGIITPEMEYIATRENEGHKEGYDLSYAQIDEKINELTGMYYSI